MKAFSRRAMLKSSLLAPAVAAAASGMNPVQAAMRAAGETAGPLPVDDPLEHWPVITNAFRERLLLDFGWRFHLGARRDPAKDFGLGMAARRTPSPKPGGFPAAGTPNFDDSDWRKSICRTIGPSNCLSKTIPRSRATAFIRWAAQYPATSIGWYRRVFELPASDLGQRISLEFDGVYRDSIVICNGPTSASILQRLRAFPFRRQRLGPITAGRTSCWCAWTLHRATAGSTKAQASIATSGWSRPTPCM